MVYDYLVSKYNIKPKWKLNKDRRHGPKYTEDMRGGFVINVDSGVTQDDLQIFSDNDCLLLSIDHHVLPKYEGLYFGIKDKSVVFNVEDECLIQAHGYTSGAGAVYLFFTTFDKDFATDLNLSYVGITLLSDARPIENKRARRVLEHTFRKSIQDIPFARINIESMIDTTFDSPDGKLDRNFIDFKFSPYVNAALRANATTELVEAMIENKPCSNYKPKQKELIQELLDNVIIKEYKTTIFAILNGPVTDNGQIEPNYIGLAATQLVNKQHKNVVILYYNKNTNQLIRGSFRGVYPDVNYLQVLREHGFIAEGHAGAFGILGYQDAPRLSQVDEAIQAAEDSHIVSQKIIEVESFAAMSVILRDIAYENQFVRPINKTYIRYIGQNAVEIKRKKNYVCYIIDGIQVKGFNENLDILDGIIQPIMSNGIVEYILEADTELANDYD